MRSLFLLRGQFYHVLGMMTTSDLRLPESFRTWAWCFLAGTWMSCAFDYVLGRVGGFLLWCRSSQHSTFQGDFMSPSWPWNCAMQSLPLVSAFVFFNPPVILLHGYWLFAIFIKSFFVFYIILTFMSPPMLAALPKLIVLYIAEPFLSRLVCLSPRDWAECRPTTIQSCGECCSISAQHTLMPDCSPRRITRMPRPSATFCRV